MVQRAFQKTGSVSFALVILTAGGCASTSLVKLGETSYPPKPSNCKIIVYTQPPQNTKYDEIALITARGGGTIFSDSDAGSVIPELKAKACEVGADAIIIKDAREGGINWVGPKSHPEMSATAIKLL